MHKLLRFYSQNRIRVWTVILAIIFLLAMIQVLNNIAKENRNVNNQEKKEETTSNVVSYHNESESIITNGSVPKTYREGFNKVIEEFFNYCIHHEPEKAYELLASDTKRILYPSQAQFEELYYKEKFEGNKEYSFQSWTQSNYTYIYQVKIFENMLATGKKKNEYIEDYVTIVPVEDGYKLNINSYIGRKQINKKNSNELLTIEVVNVDTYMDYQIYTLYIKNNTDQRLLLDTRTKGNTTYITDNRNNKFNSFLYENEEKDLILEPQEAKSITLKFNDAYREDIQITSVNFTDIVSFEQYTQNSDTQKYTLKIDL